MAELKSKIKSRNSIREWFEDFKIACLELTDAIFGEDSAVEDYENIEDAIKASNLDDGDKLVEALTFEEKKRETEIKRRFGDNSKDDEGYNKIPDKVTDSIKVNGIKQPKVNKTKIQKSKGERQRFDED